MMRERHENEQYFFDSTTLRILSTFVGQWAAPCCICAPRLAETITADGKSVALLDIDERFRSVEGFRYFDLMNPEWIDTEFDLIVCDPPFFNVPLRQMFVAMRMLAHNNFEQPLLISYLSRRSSAVLNAFQPFSLRPTGYFPSYETVRDTEKNRIEFFSNLPEESLQPLLLQD